MLILNIKICTYVDENIAINEKHIEIDTCFRVNQIIF